VYIKQRCLQFASSYSYLVSESHSCDGSLFLQVSLCNEGQDSREERVLGTEKKPEVGPLSRQVRPLGPALRLTLIALSAALYAAAIGVTAPISTPWGVGQFRPGVVFPAIFAILYGPLVGGVGAAIGTFIGDIVFLTPLEWTDPLLALIAGVPGNLIGFYFLGWFTRKYRSWNGFVIGSFIALLFGNFVAATGVVLYLSILFFPLSPLYPQSPLRIAAEYWLVLSIEARILAIFGFTFFWMVTMMPFVVPLVPPVVRALQPLVGSQVELGLYGWHRGSGLKALSSTLVVSSILFVLYLLSVFTPVGDLLFSQVSAPQFIPWLKLLFLLAATVVLAFGVVAGLVLRHNRKE